jgi:iron complex transport system substrate-binding protein
MVALRAWRRRSPISAPTGVGIFVMRRPAHRTHLAALVALFGAGAANAQVAADLVVRDDAGRNVVLSTPAQRIVSLSPAVTELLFTLGAGPRVVGRTTWCDYPPAARDVPSVGDGLNPNLEAILARRPDLVVLYRSPANTVAATRLARWGIATLVLRQDRFEDLARDARVLGRLTGDGAAGDSVAAAITDALKPSPALALRVAILAWQNPPTAIGGTSYLDELTTLAGAVNVFHDLPTPAGLVSLEAIAARDPDALLVVADSGAHLGPAWRAIRAVRTGHVIVLAGALFGRPSPRVGEAVRELRQLLEVAR